MRRRQFNTISALGLISSSSGMGLLRNLYGAAAYEMKEIRGGVGYFKERGGTIAWCVQGDEIAVVDSQFPEQAGHLIEEIRKRSSTNVDLLINSHHHGDHTAGNIAFAGMVDKVLAHENSKANQQRVAEERGTLEQQLLPDETFTDNWSGKVGQESIALHYYGQAHTDGDAVIHFEHANVVHLGDLVFNRRFPYIDTSAGASVAGWIKVLSKINRTMDNETIFICGHSDNGHDIILGKGDIAAFSDYLENLLTLVTKEVKAGRSDEEILSATEIPGSPEWQGKGVERSLKAALSEVRGE